MSTRRGIATVFGAVALATAALPSGVMAAISEKLSILVLPILTAVFAAGWSALLGGGIKATKQFGYPRGLTVAVLSFLSVAMVFPFISTKPYGEAVIAFVIVAWGFLIFPGFVGAAIAVWLLKTFSHEPNSAMDSETYSAPLRAPSSARHRGR